MRGGRFGGDRGGGRVPGDGEHAPAADLAGGVDPRGEAQVRDSQLRSRRRGLSTSSIRGAGARIQRGRRSRETRSGGRIGSGREPSRTLPGSGSWSDDYPARRHRSVLEVAFAVALLGPREQLAAPRLVGARDRAMHDVHRLARRGGLDDRASVSSSPTSATAKSSLLILVRASSSRIDSASRRSASVRR